jgi:type III secretory pathway component EscT
MIKLINLVVKILATVIVFFLIGGLLTILSILFWDTKYIEVADDILENMIWK